MSASCPCCSGRPYASCCRPAHLGDVPAPTAERLMRSRYTAFAMGERDYLLLTWHRSTRPSTLELDQAIRWIGLEILSRTGGSLLENDGSVEFRATYRVGGTERALHENSRFVKQDGRWTYLGAG